MYTSLYANVRHMISTLYTKSYLLYRIDAILKGWNDYLIDYPYFFYYIATIIDELKYIETVIPPLLLTSPKSDKKYTTTARGMTTNLKLTTSSFNWFREER